MTGLTIVDLALHAAAKCKACAAYGRPVHECTMENGDTFHHGGPSGPVRFSNCEAGQIWELIIKMEKDWGRK